MSLVKIKSLQGDDVLVNSANIDHVTEYTGELPEKVKAASVITFASGHEVVAQGDLDDFSDDVSGAATPPKSTPKP